MTTSEDLLATISFKEWVALKQSHADLLAALQVAEAELENHVNVPGVSEHVLPAVRAAIARVEGK